MYVIDKILSIAVLHRLKNNYSGMKYMHLLAKKVKLFTKNVFLKILEVGLVKIKRN